MVFVVVCVYFVFVKAAYQSAMPLTVLTVALLFFFLPPLAAVAGAADSADILCVCRLVVDYCALARCRSSNKKHSARSMGVSFQVCRNERFYLDMDDLILILIIRIRIK